MLYSYTHTCVGTTMGLTEIEIQYEELKKNENIYNKIYQR